MISVYVKCLAPCLAHGVYKSGHLKDNFLMIIKFFKTFVQLDFYIGKNNLITYILHSVLGVMGNTRANNSDDLEIF